MKESQQWNLSLQKLQSDAMNDFLKHQSHMLHVMNEALKKGNVGAATAISQMEQQNYNIYTRYSQYQTELSSACNLDTIQVSASDSRESTN